MFLIEKVSQTIAAKLGWQKKMVALVQNYVPAPFPCAAGSSRTLTGKAQVSEQIRYKGSNERAETDMPSFHGKRSASADERGNGLAISPPTC